MAGNWHWIHSPEYGGAAGNAAAKLFRGHNSSAAELLSREVIQNSWDAAQALVDRPGHEFRVRFKFRNLGPEETAQLRSTLSAKTLEEHLSNSEPKQTFGEETLIGSSETMSVLYIEDHGSHGLFGHPRLKSRSHLYKALYVIGATGKADSGGGGSFGFGKSAFIRASYSNTVVAYSCFEKFEDDPATRRLIGFTWWDPSNRLIKGAVQEYEGRAIFGEFHQGNSGDKPEVNPFEDEVADQVAISLGIEPREPSALQDLGTTLMLLDPNVTPEDLITAIELNWWPALVENRIHVEVETASGELLHPHPSMNADLQGFIRAFEIATKPIDAGLRDEENLGNHSTKSEGAIATMGLTATLFAPEDMPDQDLKPQVALIRHPHMVIRYFDDFQSKRVKIRGVYVVRDDRGDVDNLLKKTEPPAHDAWEKTPSADIPEAATKLAKQVASWVSAEVNKFAKNLSPEPSAEQKAMPEFSKYFGMFFGKPGGKPLPPPGGGLPVAIHYGKVNWDPIPPNEIAIERSFELSSAEKKDGDFPEKLLVKPSLVVLQDEALSSDSIDLRVFRDDGSEVLLSPEGDFTIDFDPSETAKFNVKSAPFLSDFSTKLIVELNAVEVTNGD